MRVKVTENFTSPETQKAYTPGDVLDGREARLAVVAGKAERYNYRAQMQDARKLILSGAKMGVK